MESKWVDISNVKVGDLLLHNFYSIGNKTISVCTIINELKNHHTFDVIASRVDNSYLNRKWFLPSTAIIAGKILDRKDLILYTHWKRKSRAFLDLLKETKCQET